LIVANALRSLDFIRRLKFFRVALNHAQSRTVNYVPVSARNVATRPWIFAMARFPSRRAVFSLR
jgi:hypothetical protein